MDNNLSQEDVFDHITLRKNTQVGEDDELKGVKLAGARGGSPNPRELCRIGPEPRQFHRMGKFKLSIRFLQVPVIYALWSPLAKGSYGLYKPSLFCPH